MACQRPGRVPGRVWISSGDWGPLSDLDKPAGWCDGLSGDDGLRGDDSLRGDLEEPAGGYDCLCGDLEEPAGGYDGLRGDLEEPAGGMVVSVACCTCRIWGNWWRSQAGAGVSPGP